MANPAPEIPEPICRIFVEWAKCATQLAEHMPDSALQKSRILQASGTMDMLGTFGAHNVNVLQKPDVTYNKIEFMTYLMEAVQPRAYTPTTTLLDEITQVREWLASNRSEE